MTEKAIALSKRPNAGQSLRTKSKAWKALAEFEVAAGGRDDLREVVALAPKSSTQAKILALLADPQRQTDSLATICADAGVHANEMLTLFREGSFARAYAKSHQILAERLPGVVEEVADQAVPQIIPCKCRLTAGGFTAPADAACSRCKGTGVVHRKSSIQHQQLLLEAAELLKKGTGVNVQVQQNVGVIASEGFFEKLVKATDDPAYDVTVIEVDGDRSARVATNRDGSE